MKAFEFNLEFNPMYPEDMYKIIAYLERRGKLNVNYNKLEDLYADFSDEKYCAGWMAVNDDLLMRFAKWLSVKEVY